MIHLRACPIEHPGSPAILTRLARALLHALHAERSRQAHDFIRNNRHLRDTGCDDPVVGRDRKQES
jgi:hypothetical protein